MGFEYSFGTPASTRDTKSRKLSKIVKTEYLVIPLMSLVGSVGGTLGMFLGFSFIGTSEWFIGFVETLLGKILVNKKKNNKRNSTIKAHRSLSI